jgi:hypothetical protein
MIYDGDPVDAIVYFKTETSQANAAKVNGPTCGNVETTRYLRLLRRRMLPLTAAKGQERQVHRWSGITVPAEDGTNPLRQTRNETTAGQQLQDSEKTEPGWYICEEKPVRKYADKQYMVITA